MFIQNRSASRIFRIPRQIVTGTTPFSSGVPEYPRLWLYVRLRVERAGGDHHGAQLRYDSRHRAATVRAEVVEIALRLGDLVLFQQLFAARPANTGFRADANIAGVAGAAGFAATAAVAMVERNAFALDLVRYRSAQTAAG